MTIMNEMKPRQAFGAFSDFASRHWRLGLLSLLGLHAVWVLLAGLNQPLSDIYYFRQTQTALTAYWIMQGGPWLAYETPVLGAPFAIPFEFPTYQLIVAAIAKLGVPLDAAGRLVSFLFYIGSLWPLRVIFRRVGLSDPAYFASAALFLCSPLYLFWGRTFLMESCALFFALVWLALVLVHLDDRRLVTAAAAVLAGLLAVLTKSTTFPAFLVLGSLALGLRFLQLVLAKAYTDSLRHTAISACLVFIPLAGGFLWVAFSDSVKELNELGRLLTSASLSRWNFGTIAQKLGPQLWVTTIAGRVVPDTLGFASILGIVALGAALTAARTAVLTLLAIVAFIIPFVVFTNLHLVHNYYQFSNAVLLIAAVGIAVGQIEKSGMKAAATGVVAVLIVGQLVFFHREFMPEISRDKTGQSQLRIAQMARDLTPPDAGILSMGDDWTSAIPYFSERKVVSIPRWAPAPLVERILADPQRFLGVSKFTTIVSCDDAVASYAHLAPILQTYLADKKTLASYGGCRVLAP